jgi:uncharacterized protein (TIGR00369 family)
MSVSFTPELLAKHTGVELLQMMADGEINGPPIAKLLNFRLTEVEKGRAIFRGTPSAEHYNPAGTVHGAWAATILDSALGCSIQSMLPIGMMFTTVEIKVNMVRPMFDTTGEVICESNVLHFGRTIATSEGTLKNSVGKLIAHGTCTCAVLTPRQ